MPGQLVHHGQPLAARVPTLTDPTISDALRQGDFFPALLSENGG
jgi:hypothetical protein